MRDATRLERAGGLTMDIDLAALRAVVRERELSLAAVLVSIETSLVTAYRAAGGSGERVSAEIDRETGHVTIWVTDSEGVTTDETPDGFGRVAAATARQVLLQRLRRATDEQVYAETVDREGQVVSGIVQQSRDPDVIRLDLGSIEATMPRAEWVPGEDYSHGRRLRVFVCAVRRTARGPVAVVSRSHPGLVRGLFEREVPEIHDGSVEITAVAREPGHRSKIAVRTSVPNLNPKGACIGVLGARVRSVMAELNGEKIDIVDHHDDPVRFVRSALSPAQTTGGRLVDEQTRAVQVIVPASQLSLAIGRDGQNARLAARLTRCRIDIQPGE